MTLDSSAGWEKVIQKVKPWPGESNDNQATSKVTRLVTGGDGDRDTVAAEIREGREKMAYERLAERRARVARLQQYFELAKSFFKTKEEFEEAIGLYFQLIDKQTQFANRKNYILYRALEALRDDKGAEVLNEIINTADAADLNDSVDLPEPFSAIEFVTNPKEFFQNIIKESSKPVKPVESVAKTYYITQEDKEKLKVIKSTDVFRCVNGHGSLRDNYLSTGGRCPKCGQGLNGQEQQGRNEFGRQVQYPWRDATDPEKVVFRDDSPGEVKLPLWLDENTLVDFIVKPVNLTIKPSAEPSWK